ncbi:hypothetical protein IJ182_02415 [bacterium]|nr:hypothetical protein [bacterium]
MQYIIPLLLTIIIELTIVYLLGFKNKKLLILVIIANIITNPVLNFIVGSFSFDFIEILILEAIVVIFEGLFLKLLYRTNLPYFRLSFIMNASSYLIGLWLPWDVIGRIF